jgi:hypothetical protein
MRLASRKASLDWWSLASNPSVSNPCRAREFGREVLWLSDGLPLASSTVDCEGVTDSGPRSGSALI